MTTNTQTALNAYQTTGTSSIAFDNPHQLILRLMNGALDAVAQAKGAMKLKNISKKGELLSKAIAIISELDACLDSSHDTALSENLGALYEYMNHCLLEGNVDDDIAKLDEVSKLLSGIRDVWAQIPQKLNSEKS